MECGFKIAIISPATEVKPFWVEGCVEELRHLGYRPVVMPHALGPSCGTFAASDSDRLADLRSALLDPEVKAILCSRGGYGCVHLMSRELEDLVRENPKWLIGFSDVSALHALWRRAGVPSLHCSMARQLALFGLERRTDEWRLRAEGEIPDEEGLAHIHDSVERMLRIISGEGYREVTECATPPGALLGDAEGEIIGGNLAVLNGLASTRWDMLDAEYLRGRILFLEDIGEKIYQTERMLKRLQLAGVFESAAGIIFGQFTEYKADRNFHTMEEMIAARFREWNVVIPVALGFPIGHTAYNVPVAEGAHARLSVTPALTRLEICSC